MIPKLVLDILSAAAETTIISNRLKSITEKMDSGNKVQLHKAWQLFSKYKWSEFRHTNVTASQIYKRYLLVKAV